MTIRIFLFSISFVFYFLSVFWWRLYVNQFRNIIFVFIFFFFFFFLHCCSTVWWTFWTAAIFKNINEIPIFFQQQVYPWKFFFFFFSFFVLNVRLRERHNMWNGFFDSFVCSSILLCIFHQLNERNEASLAIQFWFAQWISTRTAQFNSFCV